MDLTAARILQLNGNMQDSEMMEIVRRFHALASSRGLPYCVVGGMAVIRNGYPRTTADVDVLTFKESWRKLLPLQGEIASEGLDRCVDTKTGVTIDVLFTDGDWQIPMGMPDPRKVAEYDEQLMANFIGLHALVQLKMAVYLGKLHKDGPEVAAKDLGDAYELIRRNLKKFSKEVFETYQPDVRKRCIKTYDAAMRKERKQKRGHGQ